MSWYEDLSVASCQNYLRILWADFFQVEFLKKKNNTFSIFLHDSFLWDLMEANTSKYYSSLKLLFFFSNFSWISFSVVLTKVLFWTFWIYGFSPFCFRFRLLLLWPCRFQRHLVTLSQMDCNSETACQRKWVKSGEIRTWWGDDGHKVGAKASTVQKTY